MKVGSLDIVPLVDGIARVPITEAVSHPDGLVWDCPQHPTNDEDQIRLDIGSFLVRIRDRVILVDAGGGVFSEEGTTTGDMINQLRIAGVAPEEVTDVCFTHMHWDHVGWSTVAGDITFPRATFHVHQADWDYFMTGPSADSKIAGLLWPIESHLETFDRELELATGFIARPAPGHTPGTTIYLVSDSGERALLLGDTLHTVGELTDPEWQGLWDVDPVAAGVIRSRIAEELMETGDAFAPAHFPHLAFGRLIDADGMRRFTWVTGGHDLT